ncbi:hypothetical protein CVT25_004250 [Psilocybe cyanescens]|uniref:Uncharacterized protein n=1 Tax=Psilocybe cyanescens TaxID=93625 RepID=A0A409XDW2_PSICY|nr:hypothetical protein CVT25_004250 [Psilocybe cyanescens]
MYDDDFNKRLSGATHSQVVRQAAAITVFGIDAMAKLLNKATQSAFNLIIRITKSNHKISSFMALNLVPFAYNPPQSELSSGVRDTHQAPARLPNSAGNKTRRSTTANRPRKMLFQIYHFGTTGARTAIMRNELRRKTFEALRFVRRDLPVDTGRVVIISGRHSSPSCPEPHYTAKIFGSGTNVRYITSLHIVDGVRATGSVFGPEKDRAVWTRMTFRDVQAKYPGLREFHILKAYYVTEYAHSTAET